MGLVDIVSHQVGIQDRTVRLLGMIIMVLRHLLLAAILTPPLITMDLRLLLAHLITMGPITTQLLDRLLTTVLGKFSLQK